MLARLKVAALGVGLTACVAETDASSPVPYAADSPDAAVVAIVSPNGDPTFVCTAEVIAPRVVVSAAHCFRGGNYDKTGWTFELVLGADVHAPAPGDRRIAVTSFRLHPAYESPTPRADGSDGDIAVGFVAEDLPVAGLPWNSSALPADVAGRSARYVGFGANDPRAKGRRHSEAARVSDASAAVVDITASHVPCHGDSGGPLLLMLSGRETIVGVGHTAQGDDAGNCVKGASYTRTDLFAKFLSDAVAPR